ncbi:predicted protein [Plenodomus lingam JN3]|uniref:Predicted protein n=1 Tax=Leptosphaeria maculans (strain JN3 / isolate v23.1.3 / race Av1-4-5-6-7-8) TaxID=985895 RepID=E5A3Z6_LEPMJ|nr:predicted protein [Plenodomus lingam JN3]CBX98341.1 predicted protein [Plenodomus lingam JN3]
MNCSVHSHALTIRHVRYVEAPPLQNVGLVLESTVPCNKVSIYPTAVAHSQASNNCRRRPEIVQSSSTQEMVGYIEQLKDHTWNVVPEQQKVLSFKAIMSPTPSFPCVQPVYTTDLGSGCHSHSSSRRANV